MPSAIVVHRVGGPEELRFGLKTYEVQSIDIGDDAIKVRFQ